MTRTQKLLLISAISVSGLCLCAAGIVLASLNMDNNQNNADGFIIQEPLTVTDSCDVKMRLGNNPGWEFVAETLITNNTSEELTISVTAWWGQYGHDNFEASNLVTILPGDAVRVPFAYLDNENDLSYASWINADRRCGIDLTVQ